jgi:transposase
MPKHHPPYTAEFRRRLLDLVRAGRTPESLSREFRVTAQSIRDWKRQADLDASQRTDGLTTSEREELVRLRRENRRLLEEREILKRAAAWFAKESTSGPKRDSGS